MSSRFMEVQDGELHGPSVTPSHSRAVIVGSGAKLIKGNLNKWLQQESHTLVVHQHPLQLRWDPSGLIELFLAGTPGFPLHIFEQKEQHAWFAYEDIAMVDNMVLVADGFQLSSSWKLCRTEHKWSKEFSKRSYLSVRGNVRLSVYKAHQEPSCVVVNVAFKQQKTTDGTPPRKRKGLLSAMRSKQKRLSMPLSPQRNNWVSAGASSSRGQRRLSMCRSESFSEFAAAAASDPFASSRPSSSPADGLWKRASVKAERGNVEMEFKRRSFLPERARSATVSGYYEESPPREMSFSPARDSPYSPSRDSPYSPSRDSPYSPSRDSPYSPRTVRSNTSIPASLPSSPLSAMSCSPRSSSTADSPGSVLDFDLPWAHASPTPAPSMAGIRLSEPRLSPPRQRAHTDVPHLGSRFEQQNVAAGGWWGEQHSGSFGGFLEEAHRGAEPFMGMGEAFGSAPCYSEIEPPDFSTVTVNDSSGEPTHLTASDLFDDTFSDCTLTLTTEHAHLDPAVLIEDSGVDAAELFDFSIYE